MNLTLWDGFMSVYLLDNASSITIFPIENNLAIAPSEYSNGLGQVTSTGKMAFLLLNLIYRLEAAWLR